MPDLMPSTNIALGILVIFLVVLYAILRAYFIKRKLTRQLMSQFESSRYSDASGNSYQMTFADRGNYGEYLTFLELEKLNGDKRILSDLYLPIKDGKTTEIDLVMIHPTGIYVFESKNYSGKIYGNEAERYWTQYLNEGTVNKLYNPIWQNRGHLTALSYALGRDYDDYLFSYIVFSEHCELSTSIKAEQGAVVLKRDLLVSRLRHDMAQRKIEFMQDEIDELEIALNDYARADKKTKAAHLESVILKYRN
jgi:hypothetical protein